MKIFIVFEILNQPTGGGNQFLKMLKKQFDSMNLLTSEPSEADIFLFNSHHFLQNVASYKKSFPKAKFIHRIDGPMRLYNDLSDPRDQQVYFANETFADATIYQSEWSKDKNLEMGLQPNALNATIQNCADDKIFFPEKNKNNKPEKTILFSSSWSDHPKKGFSYYEYLDRNLDFEKYEYYFAGRSPINFKNIKNLGPLDSKDLADLLRKSHVFITASQNDPCSNSLIEAVSCGLQCLALNSGGHKEIVTNESSLFSDEKDLLNKLNNLTINNDIEIKIRQPKDVAMEYVSFFNSILNNG